MPDFVTLFRAAPDFGGGGGREITSIHGPFATREAAVAKGMTNDCGRGEGCCFRIEQLGDLDDEERWKYLAGKGKLIAMTPARIEALETATNLWDNESLIGMTLRDMLAEANS